MKIPPGLLRDTALYVREYFDTHFSADFTFHNYERTLVIVKNCDVLAVRASAGGEQSRVLHLAAWFLETGYCKDYRHPQERSAEHARNFLLSKGVGEEIISEVEECILSTRQPPQPLTLPAQILCDASTYHLAGKESRHLLDALRREQEVVQDIVFSDEEWRQIVVQMIHAHYYFTEAAVDLFEKKKKKLLNSFQKTPEKEPDIQLDGDTSLHPEPGQEKTEAPEPFKPERGVETFFRVSQRRHMDLSRNAHEKASLLISINSIVISIVLSVLITKLDSNRHLLIPTLFLVLTCSITITLAIISTRPRLIKRGSRNRIQEGNEVNLLYFHDSARLSLREYRKLMKETFQSSHALYDNLSRDLYYQGLILDRKFLFLNIAYSVFLYGFLLTIASFIAAFIIHSYQVPTIG